MSEAAEARQISEYAMLVRIQFAKDPAKLLKDLERAQRGSKFTRTGKGRQPDGGGIRLGDLTRMLGKPKVQFVPQGALKRGD